MRAILAAAAMALLLAACATPASPPNGAGPASAAAGCASNAQCPAGQYCDTSPRCGPEARGACKARPEVCAMMYAPVTGCDGKRYGNACEAGRAGVAVDGSAPPLRP